MAVLQRHRSPQLFSSRPAGAVRTVLLIAVSIMLMAYDRQHGHLEAMHAALSSLVYPVQWAVNAPHAFASWAGDKLATHGALVSENAELKDRLRDADARLLQLAALEQENQRLRTLMQATMHVEGRISVAQILASDMDPFRHVVTINKGQMDGIYTGQVVLDSAGLVGQVTRVAPLSSEVTLISDPAQAIQVEVNRTGLRTLAVGTASLEELSLPYLTNNADVKPGDLLVSSGLGGRYPAGYPVGTVLEFQRNPAEPFARVSARTASDLTHGHNVLLYWPPPAALESRQVLEPSGKPVPQPKMPEKKRP